MNTEINERQQTIYEIKKNRELAEVSTKEIAQDLGSSKTYIESVLELNWNVVEDIWVLKNYLDEKIIGLGKTPFEYTTPTLSGEPEDHQYMNVGFINNGQMSAY